MNKQDYVKILESLDFMSNDLYNQREEAMNGCLMGEVLIIDSHLEDLRNVGHKVLNEMNDNGYIFTPRTKNRFDP